MHDEDSGVLLVGRRNNNGTTDIVNVFSGKEALNIYQKIISKKEK